MPATGSQTSLADRKRRAGQRLILGFAGPAVTDDLRRLVDELQPAGFILFERNVEEPLQVRELNRELASLVDPGAPAWLSVDQEGGREQRVRATVWPSLREVGLASRDEDPEPMVRRVSRAIALELRALGFNLNLAPVADVDSNPDNPIIGDRAFGPDPHTVAAHVEQFVQAHQALGVVACAKHFPGHGDTSVDSHLDLPVVEADPEDLARRELVPFAAAIEAGVGAVMTAHVLYPTLDERWPATLSRRIVEDTLRGEQGFDGVVISDGLEMKALAGRYAIPKQAERMTLAGVDLLLSCRDTALQHALFEALVYLQEGSPALERACITSVRRVEAMRERFIPRQPQLHDPSVLGCSEHLDLARLVRTRATG